MNKTVKEWFKYGLLLITYAAAIILLIVYIKEILKGIHILMGYASPFIIGIVIAFFLYPPYRALVKGMQKIKFPIGLSKFLATIIVLAGTVLIIRGVILIVIPQVISNFKMFYSNFDQNVSSLQGTINELSLKYGLSEYDISSNVTKIVYDFGNKLKTSVMDWGPMLVLYTNRLISSVTSIMIGIIFSIYVLNSRKTLLRQFNRINFAVFPKKPAEILERIGNVLITTIDNYVVGQCIEAVILGCLCFLGMRILNFEYAGMLSVVVAVTALIPMVGAWLGGAIGIFLYLLVKPINALIFLIFFILLQQFENNLIYPRVVGSKIGLPGIWVIVAVCMGGQIGGFLGMMLGVPVFTAAYILIKDFVVYREEKVTREKMRKRAEEIQNDQFFQMYDDFYKNRYKKEVTPFELKETGLSDVTGEIGDLSEFNKDINEDARARAAKVMKEQGEEHRMMNPNDIELERYRIEDNGFDDMEEFSSDEGDISDNIETIKSLAEEKAKDIEEAKQAIYEENASHMGENEAVLYIDDEDNIVKPITEEEKKLSQDTANHNKELFSQLLKEQEETKNARMKMREAFRKSRSNHKKRIINNDF